MGNQLSQPYCEFDAEEWEAKMEIPCKTTSSSTATRDVFSCYYHDIKDDRCVLHRDVSTVTVGEISKNILNHFRETAPDSAIQRVYNTLVGMEIPGFHLGGRTFQASQGNEIDIRHLIAHGDVNLSGSDIVNTFRLRYSLFTAEFNALGTSFTKSALFDYSNFEKRSDFRRSQFDEGASFFECTVEGDLDLSQTTIKGELNLGKATIEGNLLLHEATIEGDLVLRDTEVTGTVNLKQATIKGAVRAEEAETGTITLSSTHLVGPWVSFNHDIGAATLFTSRFESGLFLVDSAIKQSFQCREITTEGGFRWQDTTAEGSVEFINCQFNHITSFYKGEIGGVLNVGQSDMDHHFLLVDIDVEEDVRLNGTELGSYTLLSKMEVGGELTTNTANATGVLRFRGVNIGGVAKFRDLAVGEHLEFDNCSFESSLELNKTVVDEYIQFQDGVFDDAVLAQNCRIGRNFEIVNASCAGAIDLTAAQIGTLYIDDETVTDSLLLNDTHVTERVAQLQGVTVREELSLENARFNDGIRLESAQVGSLSLDEATVDGTFFGKHLSVGSRERSGSLTATGVTITGQLHLEEAAISEDVDLEQALVKGEMNTDGLKVRRTLSLSNAVLGDDVGGAGIDVGELNLSGVTFRSGVLFHRATIQGNIDASQATSIGSNITFTRSTIYGAMSIVNADLAGDLIVTDCRLGGEDCDEWSPVDRADAYLSDEEPSATLNAATSVIEGEFLIEDSYIKDTVYVGEGKLRAVTLDDTTVTGSYYINEAEISQTLNCSNGNVFGTVDGSDLRLGSKCEITSLTAKSLDLGESLFKWNVTISDSLLGDVSLDNATFRNKLRLVQVMAYNKPITLTEARIADISITWAPGSTTVECERAELGNLETSVPEEDILWERIRINRTRFDEFDFADFTKSLTRTNHLIHQDEARSRSQRYTAFLPTFVSNIQTLRREGDMSERIKTYEDREVTYRRAKDSADTTGDNPAASKFYMHEKKFRRRRRFWEAITNRDGRWRNLFAWLTNIGLGVLAGHGERAMQVGASAVALIVVSGFLLTQLPTPTGGTPPTIISALEESLRAFIGAAPTDLRPSLSPLAEMLLLFERALGIAFVPLLVFTLTRSLHR